jgi:hypothetical protein
MGSMLLNPRATSYRISVLICACFLIFGNYFVYDLPGALVDTIKQTVPVNGGKMDQATFQLLYSIYNFPNIALALVGGIMIDKFFGVHAPLEPLSPRFEPAPSSSAPSSSSASASSPSARRPTTTGSSSQVAPSSPLGARPAPSRRTSSCRDGSKFVTSLKE